jgi:hypothetical protein
LLEKLSASLRLGSSLGIVIHLAWMQWKEESKEDKNDDMPSRVKSWGNKVL